MTLSVNSSGAGGAHQFAPECESFADHAWANDPESYQVGGGAEQDFQHQYSNCRYAFAQCSAEQPHGTVHDGATGNGNDEWFDGIEQA